MTLANWITASLAATVVLIGVLQYLTACKQWQTTNNQAAFDLFEERYEIYQELRDIADRARAGHADREMFAKTAEVLERAQFLFGQDIVTYLKQFAESLSDLECVASEIGRGQGSEVKGYLDEQRRLKNQIETFFTEGTALFSGYLRFDNKIH
jgi:hypothetical protein